MGEQITLDFETEIEESVQLIEIRYAWGYTEGKTWFITYDKNKKNVPSNSVLLYKLFGIKTHLPMNNFDSHPKVGHVVCDIKGNNFLIEKIEWL